jgi:hypothetical protein
MIDWRFINVSNRTLSRASLIWNHLFKLYLFEIDISRLFKIILRPRIHSSSLFSFRYAQRSFHPGRSILHSNTKRVQITCTLTPPQASHSLAFHFLIAQNFPKHFSLKDSLVNASPSAGIKHEGLRPCKVISKLFLCL